MTGRSHRKLWGLAPRIAFLNHGSFGACPIALLEKQRELRREMEAEPVQFLWRHYEERLDRSRAALARFVGARSRDLVFVTNTTTGVNAAVRSLRLRPGDELLTTSHDYNACHNVLVEAVNRAGARLIVARVPFPIRNEKEAFSAILEKATRRTRLAMIDHVTSDSALVFPIEKIVRELQSRGVDVLVDGAHAPGMVPLHLERLGAAYYTGNLHKWVCAPKGAAFLFARDDRQAKLQPAVISHGQNRPRRGYSAFQDRFDWAGTFDPTAWFCVGEAIRWMSELLPGGWTALRRRNHELAIAARALLCRRLGVEAPAPESMIGAMATLPLPERFQGVARREKIDREQMRIYDEFQVEVPFVRWGKPEMRGFRISAQIYNSMDDYDRLARAIQAL